VGSAFAILLVSIAELRETARLASHSRDELAAASRLEKLVIDLETGVRGFVITRQERFLEPWRAARAAIPTQSRRLARFADRPDQAGRVQRIAREAEAYVRDYSVPLVQAVRRGGTSAGSTVATAEGKRRIDALRAEFDRFTEVENDLLVLGGSIALILLYGGYLTRAIALPVRRAAGMARRLAGGELKVRMPETGRGEIGELERSFNEMAGSLEAGRDALIASRARVLTAGDEARRRVVRDLHDGAQQRLVHTIVTLKLAQQALRDDDGPAEPLVAEALTHAEQANAELRELAHGILPAVLSRGGLRAGIEALVSRLTFPVTADVTDQRFPPAIEASAYFVVAEALTNVVKHARAQRAAVEAHVEEGVLRVEVRDDGVGGASPDGTGLLELDDRLAALGGRLRVESPPEGGTAVAATLPLPR
jgi:signal transduction histidine kinase